MAAGLKNPNKGKVTFDSVSSSFIQNDNSLDIKKAILKFQEFMKEQYSSKDTQFIERNGRLLFLAFLKPILNGNGFDFKEVQTSEEKRIDVIVTFGNEKFIVELKKWYDEKAHQKGLLQLDDYLDRQSQNKGYLIIFDTRKESNQIGEHKILMINNKQIFTVWV